MIVYPQGINETLPYLISRMCDEMKPKLANVHVVFVSLLKKRCFPIVRVHIFNHSQPVLSLLFISFFFCLNLILIPTVVSRFRQMFRCSYIFLPFFVFPQKTPVFSGLVFVDSFVHVCLVKLKILTAPCAIVTNRVLFDVMPQFENAKVGLYLTKLGLMVDYIYGLLGNSISNKHNCGHRLVS